MLNVIPIPKSRELRFPCSYRGINLSSVVVKACNKMIFNRFKPGIYHELRINQNGFRNNRSTSHILAVRRLWKVWKRKIYPLFMFIDFKKAFDTVHRDKMFKILQAYGILDILVTAIKNMY